MELKEKWSYIRDIFRRASFKVIQQRDVYAKKTALKEAVWLRCDYFLYDEMHHRHLDKFHIGKKPRALSHCSDTESIDDCPSISGSDLHGHAGHEQTPVLGNYELFEASTVQEIMAEKDDFEEIIDLGYISSEDEAPANTQEKDIKRKPGPRLRPSKKLKLDEEDAWHIDVIDDCSKEVPQKRSSELFDAEQSGNCSHKTEDYNIFGKGMDFNNIMKNIEKTIEKEQVDDEHMKQVFDEAMYIIQFLE